MLLRIYLAIGFLLFGTLCLHAQAPDWAVETGNYRYTVTIVANALDECTQTDNQASMIGVFSEEGICRGVASFFPTSQGNRAFLSLHSDQINEVLHCRIYDASKNQIFFSFLPKIDFSAQTLQGSIRNPINVFYDSAPAVDAGADQTVVGSTSTTLNASGGFGSWFIQYGEGGNFENAAEPNTQFSGQYGETYMLVWIVADTECLNEMDHVFITFEASTCLEARIFDNTTVVTTTETTNVSDSIVSQATLEPNANVAYRAGQYIRLKAGFHARAGSSFHAAIEDCSALTNPTVESRTKDTVFSLDAIEIAPNPARTSTIISLPNLPKSETVQVSLLDWNGNRIKQFKIGNKETENGNFQLSVAELSSGMYYIYFQNDEATSIRKLLVVE